MAVTVTMPQLGETVTEGTILSWAKQVGDTIAEDEVLLEISTDKVDTEIPSPSAGVIREILVAEGDTVTVGTPLAVIAEPGEEVAVPPVSENTPAAAPAPAPVAETVAPAPAAPPVPAVDPAPAPAAAAAGPLPTDDAPRRGVLSPVVRKLAAEHGIDLSLVPGTGDGGRITRSDVMSFIESGGPKVAIEPAAPPAAPAAAAPPPAVEAPAPAPAAVPAAAAPAPAPAPAPAAVPAAAAPAPAPAPVTPVTPAAAPPPGEAVPEGVQPIGRLRRRIADNMAIAKATAAHVWTSVEVDYDNVERVRQAHKAAFKAEHGFSLTYLPFISRATMDALRAFPVVNSSFHLEEGQHVFHNAVNLGIAVDMNQEGLVVMTLRDADGMRLAGLARGIRDVAVKAREGRLEPDDVSGSTFTITNPGPYGSFMSAPIINVPNVGILSTDTVAKRATVITMPDGTDTIAIRPIGYLGLTWDHRVFDGSTAVLFLQRIKQNLETWDWEQELS